GRALPCVLYKARPPGPTPCQALRCIAVSGDQARLLRGKPAVVQPGGQRMRMIGHPTAAVEEVVDHGRLPTACGIPHGLGTRLEQVGELSAWRCRAVTRSPGRAFGPQTGAAL